ELRPYLEDAREVAAPAVDFVITRYRESNVNLRTQLLKIIRRAGLKPWPKLFQNLRSTRQTELTEKFQSHVVCAWIGNSEDVAREQYLQVTDEHFNRATQDPAEPAALHRRSTNAVQCGANSATCGSGPGELPSIAPIAPDCISLPIPKMGGTGL